MARFRFNLDPALRYRLRIERQRQREVAECSREIATLEGELRRLQGLINLANDDVRRNRLIGPVDLTWLAAHRRFVLATQRQGVLIVQKMAVVQQKRQEAQVRLAAAARDRKTIEKLRERAELRWKEDQARRERIESDEIGSQLGYERIRLMSDNHEESVTLD